MTISKTVRPGSFAPTQWTLGASETGSLKHTPPSLLSSISSFPPPHRGQIQSSGRAENGVPGFTPLSGSPTAGSYTYAHTMHLHLVFLAIAMLLPGDGECTDYIVPVEWPATGHPPCPLPDLLQFVLSGAAQTADPVVRESKERRPPP